MEKERDDKFLRMNFHLFRRQKYFLGQTSLFFSHKHINPVRKRHYLNVILLKYLNNSLPKTYKFTSVLSFLADILFTFVL